MARLAAFEWCLPFLSLHLLNSAPFLLTTAIKIKKSKTVTKFKVRCSRVSPRALPFSSALSLQQPLPFHVQYLFTLCVKDADKAQKLKISLPPGKC